MMASSRSTLALLTVAGAVGVCSVGACTTLLGDDFSIGASPAGGGGSGGTTSVGGGGEGGSGGATGGGGSGGEGGGGGPSHYACGWLFGQHQVVASMEGLSGEYWSGTVRAARVDGDRVRAFVERSTPGGTVVQVFTLQEGQPPQESAFPARDLYQVERTSASSLGVLYTRDDPAGPVLAVASINDGDPDGSNATQRDLTILGPSAYPSIDLNYSLRAMFTPIPGGNDVDFVVGYRQTTGNYVEGYGAYRGTPTTAVRITPNNNSPDSGASQPTLLAYHEGRSYALFGLYTAVGTRQYSLDESVTGWQTPRDLLPADVYILAARPIADTSNILAFSAGPPLRLLVSKVDNAALDTFDFGGFALAGEFASDTDLPLAISGFGWLGDVAAFMGGDLADETQGRYWFFDVDGQERGLGDLPFTAPLAAGETRPYGMNDIAMAVRETTFGPGESHAHVVWGEYHQTPNGNFDILYYDQLVCAPE